MVMDKDKIYVVHDEMYVVHDEMYVVHDDMYVDKDETYVVHDEMYVIHDEMYVVHDEMYVIHDVDNCGDHHKILFLQDLGPESGLGSVQEFNNRHKSFSTKSTKDVTEM